MIPDSVTILWDINGAINFENVGEFLPVILSERSSTDGYRNSSTQIKLP